MLFLFYSVSIFPVQHTISAFFSNNALGDLLNYFRPRGVLFRLNTLLALVDRVERELVELKLNVMLVPPSRLTRFEQWITELMVKADKVFTTATKNMEALTLAAGLTALVVIICFHGQTNSSDITLSSRPANCQFRIQCQYLAMVSSWICAVVLCVGRDTIGSQIMVVAVCRLANVAQLVLG